MSVPLKQVVKAIENLQVSKPSGSQAKTNKRAKRKQKKKAAASSGVPGTTVIRSTASVRPFQVTMARKEYLAQVSIAAGATTLQGSIYLSPFGLPWLKGVSKSFEKYRWNKLVIMYIPDVGTTRDGSVAVGLDLGLTEAKIGNNLLGSQQVVKDATYSRAKVMALTPSLVTPLWNGASLTVPSAVLQSRKWYDVPTEATTSAFSDYAPGFLAYFVTGPANTTVGDVWVEYSITFAGTREA